jgi:hypothetical protein
MQRLAMRDDTVRAVCEMAQAFAARGDVSMADLLVESGYLRDAESADEPAIERHLRVDPALVDSWARYSADQRAAPAWYMLEPETAGGHWVVGHLAASGSHAERRSFENSFAACAFYVKRVAESLRSRGREGG